MMNAHIVRQQYSQGKMYEHYFGVMGCEQPKLKIINKVLMILSLGCLVPRSLRSSLNHYHITYNKKLFKNITHILYNIKMLKSIPIKPIKTEQEEIGEAIIEAVKTAPNGINQEQFKKLVLFILYKNNLCV